MIDGTNENEYKQLIGIGDMIIAHSSGGNSTDVWLDSANKKKIKTNTHIKLIIQQPLSMKNKDCHWTHFNPLNSFLVFSKCICKSLRIKIHR